MDFWLVYWAQGPGVIRSESIQPASVWIVCNFPNKKQLRLAPVRVSVPRDPQSIQQLFISATSTDPDIQTAALLTCANVAEQAEQHKNSKSP